MFLVFPRLKKMSLKVLRNVFLLSLILSLSSCFTITKSEVEGLEKRCDNVRKICKARGINSDNYPLTMLNLIEKDLRFWRGQIEKGDGKSTTVCTISGDPLKKSVYDLEFIERYLSKPDDLTPAPLPETSGNDEFKKDIDSSVYNALDSIPTQNVNPVTSGGGSGGGYGHYY